MSSSLDCSANFVETDSCVNVAGHAKSPASLDSLPSASWEIDSNANFAWNFTDSQNGSRSQKNQDQYRTIQMPIKNIAPPPPAYNENGLWQYPEYKNFSKRIQTFWDWPRFLKGPGKEDLARAGFIYTQIGDKVTCFCCGMTLKNWEPMDDAYNEHIRWSKNCSFANMVSDGKKHKGLV
ncbi:baculoviral IAP repeat-containing protein 3-like [Saccostrea cucullata]|uniref:baculoviral IAP repeat-containing protein 3-like n=1 Tax=Saccostrea cuccullata TaxID=36930 RepID=UPI002ED536E0